MIILQNVETKARMAFRKLSNMVLQSYGNAPTIFGHRRPYAWGKQLLGPYGPFTLNVSRCLTRHVRCQKIEKTG
jgi:hypothetical protein